MQWDAYCYYYFSFLFFFSGSVCVCVIKYRLILQFQVNDWLPFLEIPDDLSSLPHLLWIRNPDPGELKNTSFCSFAEHWRWTHCHSGLQKYIYILKMFCLLVLSLPAIHNNEICIVCIKLHWYGNSPCSGVNLFTCRSVYLGLFPRLLREIQ